MEGWTKLCHSMLFRWLYTQKEPCCSDGKMNLIIWKNLVQRRDLLSLSACCLNTMFFSHLFQDILFNVVFKCLCAIFIFTTAQNSCTSFPIMFIRRNNPRISVYHQLIFFLSLFPFSLDQESKIFSLSSSPEVKDVRNLRRHLSHKKTGLYQKWILLKMGFSF